jgi:hypothetical protein
MDQLCGVGQLDQLLEFLARLAAVDGLGGNLMPSGRLAALPLT